MVPIEAAAKATRTAEIVVTDGQASSNEEEMKNLVEGADFILLPTTTQSRSIELTVEMSQMLRQYKIPYAAFLVKVDSRKEAAETFAYSRNSTSKFLRAQIPRLSAFEPRCNRRSHGDHQLTSVDARIHAALHTVRPAKRLKALFTGAPQTESESAQSDGTSHPWNNADEEAGSIAVKCNCSRSTAQLFLEGTIDKSRACRCIS